MVKLLSSVRFPQSVQLFRFCRRVLEVRHSNQKINDQRVGKILNLSPSDTSQWKRGNKLIKNVESIKKIAQTLQVDSNILYDLLEGTIGFDEAWYDFNDAEEERLSRKKLSSLQVEQTRTIELEKRAARILDRASVKRIPIDIPTLLNAFPFIRLLPSDKTDKLATSVRVKPGHYIIRYLKGNLRPHTRLAIVREIVHIVFLLEREHCASLPESESYARAEMKTLSNALLMPHRAFLNEVGKCSAHENLMTSLAGTFLVPKSVVHKRLQTLLLIASTHLH